MGGKVSSKYSHHRFSSSLANIRKTDDQKVPISLVISCYAGASGDILLRQENKDPAGKPSASKNPASPGKKA
ncbi:hypothetical protein KC338_g5 [Hortaea werneckii]|nr:hypothetical protein KC338_g5 [Hortaea werneckii]